MIDRGFGVAGALDPNLIRAIAPEVERHHYRTFWVNDTPKGDGLAALVEAIAVTKHVRLGVGVIALDRQPAEVIARRVNELKLPAHRLTLGIGAGGTLDGSLQLVENAARLLGEATGASVIVAALGPKMSALGGAVADGVLLNWLTPAYAKTSGELARSTAMAADRPAPRVDAYIRVALGEAAEAKLEVEASRYGAVPAYAAHFQRMGATPLQTAIHGDSAEVIQAGLAEFDAVLDEPVVRAITATDTLADYLKLIEAAAPPREAEVSE